MNIDLDKYDSELFHNIDIENLGKIVKFLLEKNCNYIDELLDEYLDILTFDYEDFVKKFDKINEKYDDKLIEKISEDMNILEEFYLA